MDNALFLPMLGLLILALFALLWVTDDYTTAASYVAMIVLCGVFFVLVALEEMKRRFKI